MSEQSTVAPHLKVGDVDIVESRWAVEAPTELGKIFIELLRGGTFHRDEPERLPH